MKKTVLFIAFLILAFGCDGETVAREDDGCIDWQIQVSTAQNIRLLGSDMNWIQSIEEENLRLYSTDESWNYLLNDSGEPEDVQMIKAELISHSVPDERYIRLIMGRTYRAKEIDDKRCYFLLRINENTEHQIIADYYTDCGDFILTKFRYNGTEYIANDWEVIDIVVEE